MNKLKPFKIICHNDTDGGASAICIINHIRQKYGPKAEYSLWFGTYSNVDAYVERIMDNPEQYERVFIADISVQPELAKEFPDNFILLDHHDTAKPLDGINKCIVDTSGNHCGASLCYKHLLMDQGYKFNHLTKLVKVALDYDLWQHKLPNNIAKNLNFIYYMYWGEKFVDRFMLGFDDFNAEEKEFLDNKWKEIKTAIETTNYIDVMDGAYKGKFCLIMMSEQGTETNELCEYALNTKKFDVVLCINAKKRKISTRISANISSKGLHIGMFHQSLGIGGGHERAGGAQYEDDEHLQKICESLADKISQCLL